MTLENLHAQYTRETGRQWYEFINGYRKPTDHYLAWLENIAITVHSVYTDLIDDGK